MEDKENSRGTFDGTYNKLVYEDDPSIDEYPLYSNQDKQQVSMSMPGPMSSMNLYKLLAVSLGVLAVILLAIDIGLGAYYTKLTNGHPTIMDINKLQAKLQENYNTAVLSRDEAKRKLAQEVKEQKFLKWDLEHQTRRSKDYAIQADKLQTEIASMKSHLPMIREGCRHCSPGWVFMNSLCYYFASSEKIARRVWQEAREFCKMHGGDLAKIDSREKNLEISSVINAFHDSPNTYRSGFWIGLRDVDVEGVWKWLDGTRLTEGFWNEGEPNDYESREDCAATYPRENPFYAWNDAPCSHYLQWICEMPPESAA